MMKNIKIFKAQKRRRLSEQQMSCNGENVMLPRCNIPNIMAVNNRVSHFNKGSSAAITALRGQPLGGVMPA